MHPASCRSLPEKSICSQAHRAAIQSPMAVGRCPALRSCRPGETESAGTGAQVTPAYKLLDAISSLKALSDCP
jgi:hypothetical protein